MLLNEQCCSLLFQQCCSALLVEQWCKNTVITWLNNVVERTMLFTIVSTMLFSTDETITVVHGSWNRTKQRIYFKYSYCAMFILPVLQYWLFFVVSWEPFSEAWFSIFVVFLWVVEGILFDHWTSRLRTLVMTMMLGGHYNNKKHIS